MIKTAALIYLILISHSEKDETEWHFQTQSFKFSFLNTMLIVVWGLGKT